MFFASIKYAGVYLRGILLCAAISGAAKLLEMSETALLGRAWIESLVLAILIGAVVRSFWTPGKTWVPGIQFSAKLVLEIAVMLLGLSLSFHMIATAGVRLFISIVAIVAVVMPLSYMLCRMLGLEKRISLLVACGNSICGNSAIAAVAPVIGADGEDVASSIAFTAVLGVLVVLALPFLIPLLRLGISQYGILAGLTVYAVPQVMAATMSVGGAAAQIGALVKLVRVLMLGPVILVLSLFTPHLRGEPDERAPRITAGHRPRPGRPPLHQLVPWFIIGFSLMMGVRSTNLVPQAVLDGAAAVTQIFTVLSMAALGLGVDIRTVARAGARVTAATTLSLLLLGGLSLGLPRERRATGGAIPRAPHCLAVVLCSERPRVRASSLDAPSSIHFSEAGTWGRAAPNSSAARPAAVGMSTDRRLARAAAMNRKKTSRTVPRPPSAQARARSPGAGSLAWPASTTCFTVAGSWSFLSAFALN